MYRSASFCRECTFMTKKKFNRNLNYFVPVVKKYWTCSSEDENLKRLLNFLDSQKKLQFGLLTSVMFYMEVSLQTERKIFLFFKVNGGKLISSLDRTVPNC